MLFTRAPLFAKVLHLQIQRVLLFLKRTPFDLHFNKRFPQAASALLRRFEENSEFDVKGSTGYLCAATKDTFKQVLEEVIEQKRRPQLVQRISIKVNDHFLQACALNDVLLAHPNPAVVTKCTLRVYEKRTSEPVSPPVHVCSSGLRICTGIGSTAAMHSAGGFVMAPSSKELAIHGTIYIDGMHLYHNVKSGDTIEFSTDAPQLQMFLNDKDSA
ncbi:hypothetical protein L7F22_048836 [Adiantum nelumboides]|nr:hypothetical protein [Adiantum nelumboides]